MEVVHSELTNLEHIGTLYIYFLLFLVDRWYMKIYSLEKYSREILKWKYFFIHEKV